MPPRGWRKRIEEGLGMASAEERAEEARVKATEASAKASRDAELALREAIKQAQEKASEGLPLPLVRSV